jgi:hypothetical protein
MPAQYDTPAQFQAKEAERRAKLEAEKKLAEAVMQDPGLKKTPSAHRDMPQDAPVDPRSAFLHHEPEQPAKDKRQLPPKKPLV